MYIPLHPWSRLPPEDDLTLIFNVRLHAWPPFADGSNATSCLFVLYVSLILSDPGGNVSTTLLRRLAMKMVLWAPTIMIPSCET